MGRGAPRKWRAASVTSENHQSVPVIKDRWELDLDEYVLFCTRLRLPIGPTALAEYARSQECANLCPVAIANRIEAFKFLTPTNVDQARNMHRLDVVTAGLRKRKANAGGPKRKALCPLNVLLSWCTQTGNQRDLTYQSLWYILVCTGCRPEELHTLKMRLTPNSLDIQFNGRKNEASSGAAFLPFRFQWSAPPPAHVKAFLLNTPHTGHIGTARNCASCFNSWLSKFHKKNGLSRPDAHVVSTCPRLRMDNVLRNEVDAGVITVAEYERLIGHTLAVSDQSYRR